jgi:hypothetical protein
VVKYRCSAQRVKRKNWRAERLANSATAAPR